MPLFLKSIDPEIDVFGNRQSFNFNNEQIPVDNKAEIPFVNHFIPTVDTNAELSIEMLSKDFKGFRLLHELLSTSTYGNFSLQAYSRFGSSSNIFKYDESTDKLTFFKDVEFSGGGGSDITLTGAISGSGSRTINTLLNNYISQTSKQVFNFTSSQSSLDLYFGNSGNFGTKLRMGRGFDTGTGILGYEFHSSTQSSGVAQFHFRYNNLSTTYDIFSVVQNTPVMTFNSYRLTGITEPINYNDAATKGYVDDAIDAITPQTSSSILHGYVSSGYTSNVSSGDHIKFSAVSFSRGSNISLNTSSAYTRTTNTASIGRITLLAGKTYKLTASLNNVTSNNYNATRWYNADNGAYLGLISGSSPPTSTTDRTPSAITVAYITTNVTTRVELRSTWNSFTQVKGTEDAIGPAWFTVEEV